MILEWKDEQTIKPEDSKPEEAQTEDTAPVAEAAAVAAPVEAPVPSEAAEEPQSRPARSPEAAAWEARQAQAAQKTGLERPTRPTLAETPAHPAPVEPPSKSVEVLKPMEPKSASHTPVQNKPSLQRPAAHKPSGFERVLHAARVVAPLVERLLPLLSPGVATAANAATLLLHHPSQPRIDMQPVEQELDKLDAAQSELGQKLAEQATQLKNASKRIESLEELTEQRHAELEQALLSMRAKVTVLLRLTVVLLVISLTTVGYLVLHAFKVLP